jgi:hypothetical protein
LRKEREFTVFAADATVLPENFGDQIIEFIRNLFAESQ